MKIISVVTTLCLLTIGYHLLHFATFNGVTVLDASNFEEGKPGLMLSLSKDTEAKHDPRVMPYLWLAAIAHELTHNNEIFDSDFKLPFRWLSWLDIEKCSRDGNCNIFGNSDYHCYKGADEANLPIDTGYSEATRRHLGANYLTHDGSSPQRLLFLSGNRNELVMGIIIPTRSIDLLLDKTFLIDKYISIDITHSELIGLATKVRQLTETVASLVTFLEGPSLKRDTFRVQKCSPFEDQLISIPKSDFIFDVDSHVDIVTKSLDKSRSVSCMNDFDNDVLETLNVDPSNGDIAKYFHEANLKNSYKGSHYDWRFFESTRMSTYERQAILHRLVRAWFKFTRVVGVNSWLSHGTLLGWYWNGMSLPWDLDLDVQLSIESLYKLSRNYNQTLVVDVSLAEGQYNMGMGQYFLDIGSQIFRREKENGKNVIDARFIDVRSGLYIDITALSFTLSAKALILREKDKEIEFKKVLMGHGSSTPDTTQESYEQFCEARATLWNSQNLYNCKNNHFYTLEEVGTLIPTTFEGIQCYVPKGYERILEREYGDGYKVGTYRDWKFKEVVWDRTANQFGSDEYYSEVKLVSPMVKIHRLEMERLGELDEQLNSGLDNIEPFMRAYPCVSRGFQDIDSFRIDPWIIRQNKKKRGSFLVNK